MEEISRKFPGVCKIAGEWITGVWGARDKGRVLVPATSLPAALSHSAGI